MSSHSFLFCVEWLFVHKTDWLVGIRHLPASHIAKITVRDPLGAAHRPAPLLWDEMGTRRRDQPSFLFLQTDNGIIHWFLFVHRDPFSMKWTTSNHLMPWSSKQLQSTGYCFAKSLQIRGRTDKAHSGNHSTTQHRVADCSTKQPHHYGRPTEIQACAVCRGRSQCDAVA